ncbi:MAG TPA: Sb-PDE family phosphodiesterase [Hyphomonadaceae bacterium]|nr:Sb-PDE family phosphodiesterase [Hyphomonadaceae bacterium]HPN05553.1 Sb-PDE family phosphodiesterase [Hyphomonadaceae bacterium]
MRKLFASLLVLAILAPAPAIAHDGPAIAAARKITFPKLLDGRSVLAVDLHTHSVFSDGMVWPDVRVEEAKRDGLFAMAVSEHLEYQPKIADIPHPDRNRSYQLASKAAEVKPDAGGVNKNPLMVINGSEITKAAMPAGHINAVFITDANPLKTGDALAQLTAANAQGAFTFWNHPYWHAQTPDGIARMTPVHADFIKRGLLHGIEVVNGLDMSDEAFKMALDNNLTILGTSDIHGLIDWEFDLAGGGHRTATLVLTKSETPDGLKAALKAGQTVAIYKDNLVGRKENVEAVVRSTLRIEVDKPLPRTTVTPVSIINDSPVDYMLENVGAEGAYDEAHVITVKAGSTFTVLIKNVPDPSRLSLTFKALNTYIAPREHLTVQLRDLTP